MSKSFNIDGGKGLAVLFVVLVGISGFATTAVVAAPADALNYDGDTSAPNPYFDVDDLTVASHPMEQGASDEAMAGYYDDSGDWVSDPGFVVNTTSDVATGDNVNPYSFQVSHAQVDDYGLFPRVGDENNSASALDASEWTEDEAGTAGSGAIADTEVAESADAVNIATSSQTSGDVYTASYSNWSADLDSDESKRVIQIGGEVNTLEAGSSVDIDITDESGDVKTVTIDPSASVSTTNVAANSTGTFVYQIKLNQLSTTGAGDWSNIESIDVSVADGNADVSFSWIDLQKKGKTALASTTVQADDGDYDDTDTIYNATGAISTHSMDTLAPMFDDATINDVTMPVRFEVSEMDGERGDDADYLVNWDSASQYPGFDTILNTSYRMDTPTAIDLSYSGVDLQWEQGFPGDRYITVGVAENVDSSTNLTEASLTSKTSQLASSGSTIDLDTTVATGSDYVVKFEVKLTGDEQSAMQSTGGGAAPTGGSGGGLVDFLFSIPGMMIGAGLTLLGYFKLRG